MLPQLPHPPFPHCSPANDPPTASTLELAHRRECEALTPLLLPRSGPLLLRDPPLKVPSGISASAVGGYDARRFFPVSAGIAAIAERRKVFTASSERKTSATSGSSTMATVPSVSRLAKRLGRDFA